MMKNLGVGTSTTITSTNNSAELFGIISTQSFLVPTHIMHSNSKKFRIIWGSVLLVGVILATAGIKPIALIQMAQVANGMLIFIIAGLVLWMINQQKVMKGHVNTIWQNILGAIVLILSIIVGFKGIDGVVQIFN